jgi:hypothetical protein
MNRFKNTLFAALLVAVVCMITPLAFSQTVTTGDVVGIVSDTTGAVVPGATVTLKSIDSGETRTATANDQGQYRFPLLKPGDYTVSASTPGLKSNTERFTLLVGQEQALNVTMNPQGTTTVVEVTTQGSIVQTENANLESNYNSRQVQDLPMPGGDLTTLAMTAPGVRVNVTGGSSNLNANGIPGASVLYTLNGTDQNDPANNINNSGASNNLLGANEAGEVAVVLNAYSPQYGRMAGAQVNIVGVSGTNQFHGNAFYIFNWEDLNANSFFNNATSTPRGRSDAHNFGGRFGGPIIKNKIFGFFDEENLRYVLPAAGVVSLPSPQLEAYTIGHVPAASLPLYQDMFNLLAGAPGLSRAVPVSNGPGSLQDGTGHLGCGTGTFSGTPFAGSSSFAPGTFGVNVPCAIALGTNNTELNTENYLTVRVDYNVNNSNKVFFRWNRDWGVQATGTSPINPLFNALSYQPQDQGLINYTTVITPTLVNNFVGSVIWYQAQFGVQDFSKVVAAMPQGISLTTSDSTGANGGTGFPTFGPGAYPFGFPVGRNIGHIQFNDDIAWTKGAHTIKAGFAFRYDKYTDSQIAQGAFAGVYSLNDLGDFANGKLNYSGANLGSSFSQAYPVYGAVHFRFPSVDYYLADEWAVTKNLKLTYGLRIEDNFNPTCNENCFVLTNVPFNSPSYQGGLSVPYNSSVLSKSNLFYNSEGPIPEPRFGFAWKPFGNDKTVLRGGVGLAATNYSDGLGNTIASQIPNKFTPSGLTFGTIGLAADPNSSAFSAQQSATALFNGFSAGDTLAQIKAAVAPAAFSTPSITSLPSTYHTPHDLLWSFEIDREITAHNVFALIYTGNHGYDIAETVNANAYISAAGIARYGSFGGLPAAPADARFVNVTQYYNNGVSNYDALTVQFRHVFSYGLQAQIHYTWSHALGTVNFENPFNINSGYGNLGFDNRHQLAGDFLWTQPHKFQNKIVNTLASDWTVAGKLYLYSGAPFSVVDSKIPAQINSSQSLAVAPLGTSGTTAPLADLLSSSQLGANCGRAAVNASCLTKADFATYSSSSGVSAPIQTNFGNIAPNSFYGPGYFDIDATLTRGFRIKERAQFVVGLQAYNVLNHANFANPSGSLSSGAFGTITSTLGPPTSIYGTGQGSSVSGRVAVLTGRFTF